MLCQNCKKNAASVYYKESINGHVTEYALCGECAAKLEKSGTIHMHQPSIFEDPFDSLFGGLFRPASVRSAEEKRCKLCGASFKELASGGKVGCPDCYDLFADELSPTIGQIHGSAVSKGRAPRRFGEKRQREEQLAALKKNLKSAIDAQEFERAAELRDKIKSLEAQN